MRRAAAAALGGVGLILIALAFDTGILFVPGIAIALVSLVVPGWIAAAAAGTRVNRRLHADSVVEEQPIEATLEIEYGPLGLPGCEIDDPLASRPLALQVRAAPLRRARSELRIVARFERRGRRVLGAPQLALHDPLGLVTVTREGTGEGQEVLVLPRITSPRRLPGAATDPLSGADSAVSPEPLAATEVDGLRAYRPGTPASRIHWPALARGAGLLERRLQADAGLGPMVVLDARCTSPGEPLDRAVRAAASITYELARRTGCELLLPDERRPIQIEPELGAWPGAHARLALVEGGPRTPAPALMPRVGRVFYVAAEVPPRTSGSWLDHAAGVVLVIPSSCSEAIRRAPAFEVAGCLGFVMGNADRRRGGRAQMPEMVGR